MRVKKKSLAHARLDTLSLEEQRSAVPASGEISWPSTNRERLVSCRYHDPPHVPKWRVLGVKEYRAAALSFEEESLLFVGISHR